MTEKRAYLALLPMEPAVYFGGIRYRTVNLMQEELADLHARFQELPPSRQLSLALTKLEEAGFHLAASLAQ